MEMRRRTWGGVWRRGGPARAAKPSWRPNPSRVRVCFGVQEQHAPKSKPRPHTESVWGALYMDGKIISRSFQWNWFEAQIHSESTGIVETSECPESVRLPRHNLLGRSPMYHLGAHRGISRGVIHDQNLIYSVAAATLGLGFCLVLVFSFEKQRLHCCIYGDKSLYFDPRPLFLLLLDCVD